LLVVAESEKMSAHNGNALGSRRTPAEHRRFVLEPVVTTLAANVSPPRSIFAKRQIFIPGSLMISKDARAPDAQNLSIHFEDGRGIGGRQL
jgi:hypothetical protein